MTPIEQRVAELTAQGWTLDILLLPEQCAAMFDLLGRCWHVMAGSMVPMPEAADESDGDLVP